MAPLPKSQYTFCGDFSLGDVLVCLYTVSSFFCKTSKNPSCAKPPVFIAPNLPSTKSICLLFTLSPKISALYFSSRQSVKLKTLPLITSVLSLQEKPSCLASLMEEFRLIPVNSLAGWKKLSALSNVTSALETPTEKINTAAIKGFLFTSLFFLWLQVREVQTVQKATIRFRHYWLQVPGIARSSFATAAFPCSSGIDSSPVIPTDGPSVMYCRTK